MSSTFDETMDRLECPHTNCDYYQVRSKISGSYVEDKLTLEKVCDNCSGRDHLMFDVGSLKRDISGISVGDEFEVNNRISAARSDEGDVLTVTTVAENPLYANEKVIVSVVRNISDDPPYRTGVIDQDRFNSLISNDKIEKV